MTTHTERILVPLDGSLLAEAVLPVAEALARDHDAELVLLRVTGAAVEPARTGEQIEAETYLARLSRALQQEGLGRVRTVVGHGRPDLAIVEAAEQHRVNLIAMTTHGRTGLGRVLVGSVADSVVRAAAAPVLLVHRQAEWRTGRTTQVLVPLDGSALGEAILPAVERLAGPLDFEFHLLHAVEASPAGSIALDAADAERYLAGVAGRLEAQGPACSIRGPRRARGRGDSRLCRGACDRARRDVHARSIGRKATPPRQRRRARADGGRRAGRPVEGGAPGDTVSGTVKPF